MKTTLFIKNFLFLIVLIGFWDTSSKAQGCSDAGGCSIATFSSETDSFHHEDKLSVAFEQTLALGEKFVFIGQSTLQTNYKITSSTLLSLRAPFIFTYGNLGNTSGVGDFLLAANQKIFSGKKHQLEFIIGTKLRSNQSDFSFDGEALPMAYQTSLGTYDIIGAAQYRFKQLGIYLAYQHPFNSNNNGYLRPVDELDENKLYYESAQLMRGDDLYVRTNYLWNLAPAKGFDFNVLMIYRLQEDKIIRNGQVEHLTGSDGLTINLAVKYISRFLHDRQLSLMLAFPVKDKEYRSDGLTRNLILGASLQL